MPFLYEMIKLFSIVTFICFLHYSAHSQEYTAEAMLDSIEVNYARYTTEETIIELEKIKTLAHNQNDKITETQSLIYQSNMFHDEKNMIKFGETITMLDSMRRDSESITNVQKSTILHNFARLQKMKGNYLYAADLGIQAIELEKQNKNDPIELSFLHNGLASCYDRLGDKQNAYDNYLKSYNLTKLGDSTNLIQISESVYALSGSQIQLRLYNDSRANLIKALKFLEEYPANKRSRKQLISIYIELANISILQNLPNEAFQYITKVQTIQEKLPYRKYRLNEIKGDYHFLKNEIPHAIEQYNEALNKADTQFSNNKEYNTISRIYRELGDAYAANKEYSLSIDSYNKGLRQYGNITQSEINSNLFIDKLDVSNEILKILKNKSKALSNSGDNSGALNTYLTTVAYLDKMKSAYLNEGSKFFIAEKATKIYQDAIEVFYQNYQISNQEESAENIFMTMEKNKAGVLLENLKYKFNLISSALPEEIIKQNNDFKSKISFYKKLLGEVNQAEEIDKEKQKEQEDLLFHTKEDFNIFTRKLKAEYPEYESFKSKLAQTKSIKDVQEYLGDGELLIEYLQTESKLYRLDISTDNIAVSVTDGIAVDSLIQTYRSVLSTAPDESANPDILREASKKLGELLLPKSTKEYTKITVVPDGNLTTIPYEPLILADDTYLIEQSLVTYAYSAEQLLSGYRNTKTEPKILSIAPVFEDNNIASRNSTQSTLSTLPYAQEEGIYLRDNFNAELISSTETAPSDLIDNMADYGIIHLATHASLNTTDPMMSEIHFNNGTITNYDIRDLQVQPALVVLSACNTAQGNIQKGEGIISLSRGFFEAGVKSLQSSLWSINDESSSEIVKSMYGHMKSGKSTAASLRKAKLDYLKSADKKRAHPYYWAGIIQIGQNSVLFDNGIGIGYLLAGGFGILLLLLVLFKILKAR